VATLREKIDALVERRGQDEATLREKAVELGWDQLYRTEMRKAYLRGDITREKAVEILGLEEVDELDYALEAAMEDLAWGLRRD
jgi:hypothetical protein